MKILSNKTNKENVVDYTLQITSVITVGGMEFTARTIKFYGTEKNGDLSPAAMELLDWCKLNGFEMVSRPIGKPKKNNEYYQGKKQEVIWQTILYTIK